MKRLLLFIVITAMGMGQGLAQALIQTYTDRCTGQVHVFTVPMNGQTVVAFYNKSKTFTAAQFTNGELQAWLEETYLWWTSLSPCSSTTTGATATQQTTQQTTQQAATAATNATASTATTNPTTNAPSSSTSPPPTTESSNPPSADTSTANNSAGTETASSGGTDNGSTGTNNSGSGTTETGSSETQPDTEQTDPPSSETSESSEEAPQSDTSEETSSEEKTEEVKEESTEEKKDEPKEESKEEESKEETDESSEEESEEEKNEDDSESDEDEEDKEEDSGEESDDEGEEEDNKKKKKKRNLAPPVVTANLMSQQDPTGQYTYATTIGVSRSSLLGTETYGVNAMVFSNLQQFMLNFNYSKVHIKTENITEIIHNTHSHFAEGNKVTSSDTIVRPVPRVNRVYSGSLGIMKMFSTYVTMMNHSIVWMGRKGSVKGLAFGTSLTSLELNVREGAVYYDSQLLGASLTGFYTKPFMFDRWSVSPMLAVSSPFMSYDLFYDDLVWNKDLMIIGGSSFNYSLTQRFGLNFGINIIESTIQDFPTLKTFTIGGRLSF